MQGEGTQEGQEAKNIVIHIGNCTYEEAGQNALSSSVVIPITTEDSVCLYLTLTLVRGGKYRFQKRGCLHAARNGEVHPHLVSRM